MVTVVKPVDFSIPVNERSQTFYSSELITGDYINFDETIGGPAPAVKIVTDPICNLQIRRNPLRKNFKRREINDGFGTPADPPYINTATGNLYADETIELETISASSSVILSGPIHNLEVIWSSGSFEISTGGYIAVSSSGLSDQSSQLVSLRLPNTPTVDAGTVGTTEYHIADAASPNPEKTRRVKITNGSETARLAWTLVTVGASAPTFNANFASSAGTILLPEETEYLIIPANKALYIVASAADTEYCVSVVDE